MYLQGLLTFSYPIFLFAAFFCLNLTTPDLFKKMKIIAIAIILYFQPSIIINLYDMVNCIQIDSNIFALKNDLWELCYTSEHVYWISLLAWPGILLYGIVFPFAIYLIIRKIMRKKAFYRKDIRGKYGAFIIGYYSQDYFWYVLENLNLVNNFRDFVFLYEKLVFSLLISFFTFLSNDQKMAIIAIILALISFIISYRQPYLFKNANDLMIQSNFALIFILFFSIVEENEESEYVGILNFIIYYGNLSYLLVKYFSFFLKNMRLPARLNRIKKIIDKS